MIESSPRTIVGDESGRLLPGCTKLPPLSQQWTDEHPIPELWDYVAVGYDDSGQAEGGIVGSGQTFAQGKADPVSDFACHPFDVRTGRTIRVADGLGVDALGAQMLVGQAKLVRDGGPVQRRQGRMVYRVVADFETLALQRAQGVPSHQGPRPFAVPIGRLPDTARDGIDRSANAAVEEYRDPVFVQGRVRIVEREARRALGPWAAEVSCKHESQAASLEEPYLRPECLGMNVQESAFDLLRSDFVVTEDW